MTEELANCIVATNSFDTLQGVICNGTAVNTGRLSGVIMRLELFLERPFQWIVCLLHLKIFIFCHLFDAIDRKTRAPATFSSEIRKKYKKMCIKYSQSLSSQYLLIHLKFHKEWSQLLQPAILK